MNQQYRIKVLESLIQALIKARQEEQHDLRDSAPEFKRIQVNMENVQNFMSSTEMKLFWARQEQRLFFIFNQMVEAKNYFIELSDAVNNLNFRKEIDLLEKLRNWEACKVEFISNEEEIYEEEGETNMQISEPLTNSTFL